MQCWHMAAAQEGVGFSCNQVTKLRSSVRERLRGGRQVVSRPSGQALWNLLGQQAGHWRSVGLHSTPILNMD